MKPPELVKEEFTREWVRKAENDFKTAGFLCQSEPYFAEVTAFHSQQAAEKYLKAFLVGHQIEFPKTHDIEALLKLGREGRGKNSGDFERGSYIDPLRSRLSLSGRVSGS